MLSKRALSSKIAIAGLLCLLLFLGNLKFRQWQSQRKIEAQKLSLLKQSEELQKKNQELQQSLEYLNSPIFKERVAREQLALKKEGEEVYSFSEKQETQPESTNQDKGSNPEKWWKYFFSPR